MEDDEGVEGEHGEDLAMRSVSFELEGKKHFGEIVNDSVGKPEVELFYTSEGGDHFRTGTKISVASDQLSHEALRTPTRRVKRWVAQAPIGDSKKFQEITDDNGVVVDYKDVSFSGYASTNESTTAEDRIGDYLINGAFKKTIKNFMKNPVMLIDHSNSVKEIAGTYTQMKENKNGLWVEGVVSNSPDLRNVRFLVAEGHLKSLSIGGLFLYGEDGKAIEEVNLYEISLVAIPMNPDALFSVREVGEEFLLKKAEK